MTAKNSLVSDLKAKGFLFLPDESFIANRVSNLLSLSQFLLRSIFLSLSLSVNLCDSGVEQPSLQLSLDQAACRY